MPGKKEECLSCSFDSRSSLGLGNHRPQFLPHKAETRSGSAHNEQAYNMCGCVHLVVVVRGSGSELTAVL